MLASSRKKRQKLPLRLTGFPAAFLLPSPHFGILPLLEYVIYPDRSQDDTEIDRSRGQKYQ